MRRTGTAAALAATVIGAAATAAAVAPAASAAWKPIGSGAMNISDQVSLARTSDGTLHVAWEQAGANLIATPIAPTGAVGAAAPIVSGWASVGDPAIVAQGATLTAFWPGSPTLVTGNPQDQIEQATSTDGGRSWAVAPTRVTPGGFDSSAMSAVVAGGGFLQAYGNGRPVVHVGLDPAAPAGAGYGVGGNYQLAVSGAGAVTLASCEFSGGGVFATPVDPATGAAAGPAANMPGTDWCDAAARTALVARAGGGFHIAAPDAARRKVLVWAVGSAAAATLAGGRSTKDSVALAATPDGRLWAGWTDSDTAKLVVARSNRTATKWGAAVSVAPPAGRVFGLNLDAQRDRVDAVVRMSDDDNTVSLVTDQLRPGLSLVVTGGHKQRFRVLDAGDPVAGATVRVGGRALTTDAQGRASTDLGPGRYTARATKAGYVDATAGVRAR